MHLSSAEAHKIGFLKDLKDSVTSMRNPIIAAVAGFALGGGFELAMMCDIIYAAEDAKFGLPEVTVGTIPGAGGTQRLTRILGKQKAMDMILTSSTITGKELHSFGLVAQVFPVENLLESTLAAARKIASRSAPIVKLAKQAILAGTSPFFDKLLEVIITDIFTAEETHLDSGLKFERNLYYSTFDLEDRMEGMSAFVEKRTPAFKDK